MDANIDANTNTAAAENANGDDMNELSMDETSGTPARLDDMAGISTAAIDAAQTDTIERNTAENTATETDSIQSREQLLSQLSGLTPATAEQQMSSSSREPSHVASVLRELIINAMIGVGVGSFVFLFDEILDQRPIPTTPLSVVSLFVMSALIGELTLLFKLQIPYWAILLIHCPLTFALVVGWLLTNRWYVMLSPQRFPGFAASFVGIYILIWLGVMLHGWLLTERMNRTLRHRNQRDDLDE
ncbi:MAG: DUF3021 domain-containing protein [Bifidobacterium tibiigranuli]|uniref:DUF3021 domain-containing protein n=1 Tax=Bifidobacterium tibiigranuli TaxID=2172043 RepID=UPI0023544609|nr:DUF3021 domain-containing protein [Bifidobacterium tibiigranuli]MCH3975612.1 DUF3021 domain-containing protein [Bifidobacterium tibiigranuli]MCH4189567.1 DUF3021 domain-containing protein [Bifidobacterium tibiigranuli]MCH4204453.1 DUF3021 domain-containing protein [Bifidobacterium tibiigranuli]MCH4275162.1 DUF3021 domain-containing protein [Bifidobacterium tibiigranuli]